MLVKFGNRMNGEWGYTPVEMGVDDVTNILFRQEDSPYISGEITYVGFIGYQPNFDVVLNLDDLDQLFEEMPDGNLDSIEFITVGGLQYAISTTTHTVVKDGKSLTITNHLSNQKIKFAKGIGAFVAPKVKDLNSISEHIRAEIIRAKDNGTPFQWHQTVRLADRWFNDCDLKFDTTFQAEIYNELFDPSLILNITNKAVEEANLAKKFGDRLRAINAIGSIINEIRIDRNVKDIVSRSWVDTTDPRSLLAGVVASISEYELLRSDLSQRYRELSQRDARNMQLIDDHRSLISFQIDELKKFQKFLSENLHSQNGGYDWDLLERIGELVKVI